MIPMLGAAAASALPPSYVLPSLVLAFTGLLLALRACRTWIGAFVVGWLFGFGFFAAGLYWISESFMIDADRYGWMAVPAVVLLASTLALFPALAGVLTMPLARLGVSQPLALAIGWTATEWLRGNILTGFPWNLIGYAWTVSEGTLQGVAFVGVYGLSLLTVAVAAMPALVGTRSPRGRVVRWSPFGLIVLLPLALWAFGEIRMHSLGLAGDQGVRLRIVQGNIAQSRKWEPAERASIIDRYLSLTELDGSADLTAFVWPETAVPFDLATNAEVRERVAGALPEGGYLFAGTMRRGGVTEVPGPRNSLVVIAGSGRLLATYDKARLVPFGEYVPFREMLPLRALAAGRGDIVAGAGPSVFAIEGLPPFQPLICFEAAFPLWSVSGDGAEPTWLLNVTNDAWFGRSIGPYQHFQMARTRAVESGVPLVRAANTGISAVVDAVGRVVSELELGEVGVIDATLPPALPSGTPYSRNGDSLVVAMAAFIVAVSLLCRRGRRRIRHRTCWRF